MPLQQITNSTDDSTMSFIIGDIYTFETTHRAADNKNKEIKMWFVINTDKSGILTVFHSKWETAYSRPACIDVGDAIHELSNDGVRATVKSDDLLRILDGCIPETIDHEPHVVVKFKSEAVEQLCMSYLYFHVECGTIDDQGFIHVSSGELSDKIQIKLLHTGRANDDSTLSEYIDGKTVDQLFRTALARYASVERTVKRTDRDHINCSVTVLNRFNEVLFVAKGAGFKVDSDTREVTFFVNTPYKDFDNARLRNSVYEKAYRQLAEQYEQSSLGWTRELVAVDSFEAFMSLPHRSLERFRLNDCAEK